MKNVHHTLTPSDTLPASLVKPAVNNKHVSVLDHRVERYRSRLSLNVSIALVVMQLIVKD